MPRFTYEAIDPTGKPVSGDVEAASVAEAAQLIEQQGHTIRSIAAAAPTPEPPVELATAVRRTLDRRDELAAPLEAYARELSLGEQKRRVRRLVAALEANDPLAATAAAGDDPRAWAPLLAAASDPEPGVFSRYLAAARPVEAIRTRRGLSAAYPLVVACLVLLVLWPLAAFVLPTFRSIYDDFGLSLPGATRVVLAIGGAITVAGWWVFLVAGVAAAAIWWMVSSDSTPLFFGAANTYGWPWPTGMFEAAHRTRFVSNLLDAGLSIAAIERLGGADSRPRELLAGVSLQELRPAEQHAVRLLEPAPARAALLRELSESYAERTARQVSWVHGVVGPVTIVALGLAVGFTVLALFMPLVKLIEGLT